MRIMVQVGLGTAALIFILFALLWIREARKISKEKISVGTMFNAAGFGLFPGLAAWKIFEPYCGLDIMTGKKLFDPFGQIPHLTRGERFAPDRIELLAILIAFVAIVIWIIARRQPLPGNGDLFLSVICIWSAIRTTTETLRANPARLGTDGISVFILGAIAAEITAMAIWTVRRGRKHKSAGMTLLEWLAILACSVISILQDLQVMSMGSPIANLAAAAGSSALTAALILSAGKDSREE